MNEKISLAGDLGSGKSTVSEILIREMGALKLDGSRFARWG